MDLKTACEILGLTEDCTMEELQERYYSLTERRLPRDEIDQIHDAYNVIHEHLKAQEPDVPFKEKFSNFLYHHKLHLFIGGIFALVFGMFIYSIIVGQIEKAREAKLPPPAIEIMLFGEYYEGANLEIIEERVLDMFPDWDRMKIELVYAPSEARSEFDIAALQKSMAMLVVEKPDIYIFDSAQFNKFQDQGLYVPLDQFESVENIENYSIKYKAENDDEEHIYAIDLSGHKLFAESEIANNEHIIAIRVDTKNKENALDFIEKLLDTYEE